MEIYKKAPFYRIIYTPDAISLYQLVSFLDLSKGAVRTDLVDRSGARPKEVLDNQGM